MLDLPRPSVRLLPKTDARPFRRGTAMWAYANQIVLDRRTKALAPGTIARLEDADRQPIAAVAVNPDSKIALRVIDRDPNAEVNQDWFAARIAQAMELRERLYDTPFYRLAHAEGDGLPGVIIDRFGDVAAIQPNAAWADVRFDALVNALVSVTQVTTVFKNTGGRARALEGLEDTGGLVLGNIDAPIPVTMNGATYFADLMGGQKTGLFFDQRENQNMAARLARGGTVLDVFSHVGGFALAALAGGATHATAVDSSKAAMSLADKGAEASGVSNRFETRIGDAFDVLSELGTLERRFDTVICDPPAFAPSKSALDAGLRAYEKVARLAAPLVAPGGILVLCSCSHAADLSSFRAASLRGIGRAGRNAQILATGGAGPDHPLHPHLAESGYLKSLFIRLSP